jgi:acetyl esterase/lipase
MLELDPQIAKIIAADPPGTLSPGTLAEMRATGAKPPAQPPGDVERRDHVVAGEPDVVIRVHRPAGAGAALPCVYSMHGGGYVTGSYAIDDARLDGWSRAYQCAGVSVEFGWRSYIGARYGTAHVPAYAAPARATDLNGLPPAYVCVGNVDGFRDEAIDYAMRLNQASAPTWPAVIRALEELMGAV